MSTNDGITAPDPLARTAGETLAAELGDDYAEAFARVTRVPLWADEAPLARVQRKWERFAAAVAASGSTAADVRARLSAPLTTKGDEECGPHCGCPSAPLY